MKERIVLNNKRNFSSLLTVLARQVVDTVNQSRLNYVELDQERTKSISAGIALVAPGQTSTQWIRLGTQMKGHKFDDLVSDDEVFTLKAICRKVQKAARAQFWGKELSSKDGLQLVSDRYIFRTSDGYFAQVSFTVSLRPCSTIEDDDKTIDVAKDDGKQISISQAGETFKVNSSDPDILYVDLDDDLHTVRHIQDGQPGAFDDPPYKLPATFAAKESTDGIAIPVSIIPYTAKGEDKTRAIEIFLNVPALGSLTGS